MAALSIVGVPLAIVLLIGFITASGGGSANGGGPIGTGTYSAGTQTSLASGNTGEGAPSDAPLATGASVAPSPSVAPSASGTAPALATAPALTTAPGLTTSPVSASGTATPSASATQTGPAATVLAAYTDINRHDYQAAYALGLGDPQPSESLQEYAAGYADTAHVAVTITTVVADTVWVSINATQTDGTHQIFSGTYTVSGGHITGAQVRQAS